MADGKLAFKMPVKESIAAKVAAAPAVAQSVNGRAVVAVQLCKVCATQNPDKEKGNECCKNHTVSVDATTIQFNEKGEIIGAVYL
jgi:hypothetical protein